MEIEKLQTGTKLLTALDTLKRILLAIEQVFGLTDEEKASAKAAIRPHIDTVQKQLDEL